MIIVTGASGFIGSVMIGYLNRLGRDDIIGIDDLPHPLQYKNLVNKELSLISTSEIEILMATPPQQIEAVIHLGAISDTLANDWSKVYKQNVLSTRQWANFCRTHNIPFVFASSAAVYGNGGGPLNQYAFSKSLSELELSPATACLRFFNVYGPNEYHKGRMASTIYHWYNQSTEGNLKLFKGSDQFRRDFIHVEDICAACYWMTKNFRPGVYDLGTGIPTSFETVAQLVGIRTGAQIELIDMPADLKAQYQLNTKADLTPLIDLGFDPSGMRDIVTGVNEYIDYLEGTNRYY
jgi:ADP-L-glycero-D-manno-heptose 6-epimerase